MLKLCVSFAFFFSPLVCSAYDVIGVGAPCVDFVGAIDEETLQHLPGKKGDSTLVNWGQFQKVVSFMAEEGRLIHTGGCCSNTIKGLASLGDKVAFCGRIGTDPMSAYFSQTFSQLNITQLFTISAKPIQQVTSLVTPDRQRTCFCYLGATVELEPSDLRPEYFAGARLAYIEGYALHHPGVVQQAITYAKAAGAKIAMDLNAMRVVNTFREEIYGLIESDIDLVFCNNDEILALTGLNPKEGAEALSRLCELAVVMVGENGCWVATDGVATLYPGYEVDFIDTTGAGDLFAAGFLHGYLQGQPHNVCAKWGNLTGSTVVKYMGAEIPAEQWAYLNLSMAPEEGE